MCGPLSSCGAGASHCSGFACCGVRAPGRTGRVAVIAVASLAVESGLQGARALYGPCSCDCSGFSCCGAQAPGGTGSVPVIAVASLVVESGLQGAWAL